MLLAKMAWLKELARAAYVLSDLEPEHCPEVGPPEERAQAEQLAAAAKESGVDVRACPVCSADTLVLFDSPEIDGDMVIASTFKVRCEYCTFQIWMDAGAAVTHGLPYPDYWKTPGNARED